MATITEIAEDIYRVNIEFPGKPLTYSFFVIKDEIPVMVETGFGRAFDESLEAVKKIIDPSTIRYVVVPHFEADECGAINHYLALAPHAQPIGSPIGTRTNLTDFAIRPPVTAQENEVLDLGRHKLRFLIAPYIHQWDSMLAFDDTTGTLFSSDIFIQHGSGPAITDQDVTEEMVSAYQSSGALPSRLHLDSALNKIEAVNPTTLACHHGSVLTGRTATYIKALRERDVAGILIDP
ncbi:MAG: Flavorubredoxin [Chloroflexi bacterium]|jgi:flavorubredoxin|nr:MAG: Flavorubredoxin [Chloroflexota bacterium]